MKPYPARAAVAALLLLATAACGPTPEPEAGPDEVAGVEVTSPANPTLKEIMQALETDMAGVAHGIWIEDREAVRGAAARVADHPRVPPEQMATIQATLGAQFAAFAGMDQAVHGASVALRDAAAQAPMSELTSGYQRIQEGCVSCHAAFRPRVSEALNPSGG